MPATPRGNYAGTAAAFESSAANMGILLVIAIIVVYLILGVLYDSFIQPLTILSGLAPCADPHQPAAERLRLRGDVAQGNIPPLIGPRGC